MKIFEFFYFIFFNLMKYVSFEMPVSKARTNKFYIYRQCTYIVYLWVGG
jgi:hypothetical protein